jgi:predicted TIM-barrel fold metal-dependent hydrolase
MVADRSAEGIAGWRAASSRLAQNVSVKLSGFGLGDPAWTVASVLPLLHHTLEAFGVERTMVGTNIPVDLLFATPVQIVAAIHAAVADLSNDDRIAVLRTNAERIYRI